MKTPSSGGLRLPSYTVASENLGKGASFGNAALWITTKNTGAVDRVFSIEAGEALIGAVNLSYAMSGNILADRRGHIALRPDGYRRTFELHPAYQRVTFTIGSKIAVEETTFVPLDDAADEPAVLYQMVALRNDDVHAIHLRVTAFARLRGTLGPDVHAVYDPDAHALVASNAGQPHCARVIGFADGPGRFATTLNFGRTYDTEHVQHLPDDASAQGDILGAVQRDITLAAGQTQRLCIKVALSAQGREAAVQVFRAAAAPDAALAATVTHLEEALRVACVLTPDPVINDGALWSKVNMRRVMARFPHGRAFTNDPGNTSAVVVRDSAWFVYGNDHFRPDFSRALLDRIAELAYPNGKLPEFFNAVTGAIEDDGLNINDDTPLFILAVNHHYRASGDVEWLKRIYPAVKKAAEYICSQRDERGLVFCTANDPRGDVWGIASWRNIIPNYQINGAVTEINAECVAALRAAGHLTENCGGARKDAAMFFDAAKALRAAMDEHLLNPENGLYYLNLDVDGIAHTDVTADQIFPVMFRACDDATGFRIIRRLNAPDFWTSAGLRTASCYDPLYDPSASSGLLGGVWPGLTWWYAFAAARYHPEFMVRGLRVAFEHYASSPRRNNTVPGQFGEWFDGEALNNKGMRLSPWEPPRFLWAAVEGVCGLMLTPGLPRVAPLIPQSWRWVALQRLSYHGAELTYFAVKFGDRFEMYATGDIDTDHAKHIYDTDVSPHIELFSDTAAVVALRKGNDFAILVGNVGPATSVVPLGLGQVLECEASYQARVYNSESESWDDGGVRPAGELSTLALSIEHLGFRLLELRRR